MAACCSTCCASWPASNASTVEPGPRSATSPQRQPSMARLYKKKGRILTDPAFFVCTPCRRHQVTRRPSRSWPHAKQVPRRFHCGAHGVQRPQAFLPLKMPIRRILVEHCHRHLTGGMRRILDAIAHRTGVSLVDVGEEALRAAHIQHPVAAALLAGIDIGVDRIGHQPTRMWCQLQLQFCRFTQRDHREIQLHHRARHRMRTHRKRDHQRTAQDSDHCSTPEMDR
ncbi:hypothetical protein G6F31_015294 [Rhizopus arrhizus]|uniref:Uncharacterized protein n=1 Tax=Rhizopus delemar TaxID=936053 RepID=A0A9P7C7B1_9FUNG|nr:hypothetical protein G6F31_015294 [Rhizopus arrhizus]KAG1539717.1 hypothetical protein G6F50_014463 [Rhizopus delemar]